ncbi:hypothetical protein LGN13_05165 [Burkholderia multivorans]|uniref:hypothetical protein n=1 Tax=Burkholderia multivorans TaxID=87883 RepID=UPI001483A172|nr:hypothetical protein [Burkholderia multivorans]MBU9668161.1 hypothetical protein [Burkholderia multivorans]MCA8501081.1 hypothetical protein [Burkholderia multivorans]MDN8080952.1 hypothetical protein [Burkholderia multivorans]HEF4752518.1 hypothetical protein [Burkholderia multivorans]
MTDVAPPARLGVNDAWRGTDIGRQLTTHTMRFIDAMHRRKRDFGMRIDGLSSWSREFA